VTRSLLPLKNVHQDCINHSCSCIANDRTVVRQHSAIIDVLAAFMGKNDTDTIATTCWKWASMGCQRFLAFHLGESMGNATESTQNQHIGHLYGQKYYKRYRYHLLTFSIPRLSTIHGLASWIVWGLWNGINPQSTYRLRIWATMLRTISRLPPTIECPWSVNNLCGGVVCDTAMKCIALLLNWVLCSQSSHYVLVYTFTNMHAMSHRSDFFCL